MNFKSKWTTGVLSSFVWTPVLIKDTDPQIMEAFPQDEKMKPRCGWRFYLCSRFAGSSCLGLLSIELTLVDFKWKELQLFLFEQRSAQDAASREGPAQRHCRKPPAMPTQTTLRTKGIPACHKGILATSSCSSESPRRRYSGCRAWTLSQRRSVPGLRIFFLWPSLHLTFFFKSSFML